MKSFQIKKLSYKKFQAYAKVKMTVTDSLDGCFQQKNDTLRLKRIPFSDCEQDRPSSCRAEAVRSGRL